MKKTLLVVFLLIITFKTEAQSSVFKVVDSLLLHGDYQKVLTVLENTTPKTVFIFEKTADIYQAVGNYNKAIENYVSALRIEEVATIKVKLGKVYDSAGLTSDAILIYEEIIQKDSTNLLVANGLGKLYLAKHQPKKAETIYRYLKKKDTMNPNYPYQLGMALSKQNQFYEMGDNYIEAYKIDSLHFKSIYRLAKFYKKLHFKDSTVFFINKGLAIDKNNINFNQLKANVLYTSKDYEGAIKHLNLLDSLNYKSANSYEMLGMAYQHLDSLDTAETYFEKAIKLDMMNPGLLYRMANLLYIKKENKKASFNLMMAIYAAKPDLDKQYYLLGIIQKEAGELKKAIVSFEKALENNSQNYKALFELATTSDDYYKDKKIALKRYQNIIDRFKLEEKDSDMTLFSKRRVKEIKEELFLEGETIVEKE